MKREYKDKYTLDGRITPGLGVSKAKVLAAKALLESGIRGNRVDAAIFAEQFTASDLQFNVAYLTTLNFIPQFDEAERTWSKIAGTRVVPDFNPVKLYSLFGDLNGPGIGAHGEAVTVPEAGLYPKVTITGREAFQAKIAKKGFSFDYTWEARVNDGVGFFDGLPAEMLKVALATEESEVYDALLTTGSNRALVGGTLPDDTVVLPNAKLTPAAIWQAIRELSLRQVHGRTIGRASGYNVLVPIGVKDFIQFQLNRTILSIQDGAVTYTGGDQGALAGIEIIETDRLTGNEWYILPKPGTVARPVLELARLRGYETPELRVENQAGNYLGGGAVSPFEGSFTNDSVGIRFRYVAGGVLWDDIFVLKSNGSGNA